MGDRLYQIEVKHHLVRQAFPPTDGWEVWVDIDPMEMGKGQQAEAKRIAASAAHQALQDLGIRFDAHPNFGRVDVVASRGSETVLCEVEGHSRRQSEQAMYSALGQLVLQMSEPSHSFLLAVPLSVSWRRQLSKVPDRVARMLGLSLVLVSDSGLEYLDPRGRVPQ